MSSKQGDILFRQIGRCRIRERFQNEKAAFSGLFRPFRAIIVPIENDTSVILYYPANQEMKRFLEVVRLFQFIRVLSEGFSNCSIQDDIRA